MKSPHALPSYRRQQRAKAIKTAAIQLLTMLAVAATLAATYLYTTAPDTYREANTHPPCPQEDSTNCYWDASERGNGLGNDFIALSVKQ